MNCPTCSRLFAEFERLRGYNALALERLRLDATRSLPREEYQKLLDAANAACVDVDSAGEKLEQHQRTLAMAAWG